MKTQILEIKKYFLEKIKEVKNLEELKELENSILGKSGKLNDILKGLKDLDVEGKKEIGMLANELKELVKEENEKKVKEIDELEYKRIENEEKIDVTLDFGNENKGHLHPISLTSKLLEDIFISLGFKVEDGPQIEIEEYNFDKLNIPDNHPARDVWDTFWITDEINKERVSGDKYLLRTHTSPVQVRTMLRETLNCEAQKQEVQGRKNFLKGAYEDVSDGKKSFSDDEIRSFSDLAIKIIVPGRVFRYEQEDARHTSNFYQLEGLVVGKGVTFGDLKWTLDTVMKKLLGEKTKLRFRPSIFPFTEPSAEVDVSCQICDGKGCKMCSGTGWVELLGSGMVHPKVLKDCGIDPEVYSGFAFGMGIDRIAAQRYGVSSSRMFYQNKLKLNEQF